ncbi:MAG: orotate phosphoribosyltransferase [Candidatus Odinarchaeota archaeon]
MEMLSPDRKNQLIDVLKKVGVVKFGQFVLKDGSTSSVYVDLRILPNFPEEFQISVKIAAEYLRKQGIADRIDGLVAPPLAGIPLGVALAIELKKEFYLARMEAKEHGTRKLIEGEISNKRILIVDDVITSGGSKVPILNAVRDHGAVTDSLFVFVNRVHSRESLIELEKELNVTVKGLLSLDDLINASTKQ